MSKDAAFEFIPAKESDKRSPCPALNALANHGYLPRDGTDITFSELLRTIKAVYNLSFPLALLLTLAGFLTCARLSISRPTPKTDLFSTFDPFRWLSVSWTLNLSDLSARGWNKIAHDASLVHPSGVPSHAPDPALVSDLLASAHRSKPHGLTLDALAAIHARRERGIAQPLSSFHDQVAQGESALAWLVMQNPSTGAIDEDTLKRWFGEERLPEGWWESRRPVAPVGLSLARRTAGQVRRLAH
ncbi:heme-HALOPEROXIDASE domain-containing protein [Favolaschia claudopus]|uniref:Heme-HALOPEROXIDASE domain-containing protein n=1 Tax=Favolaschia claudopus TaxID=2862362 RepID=A0AAW0BSR5_9AGAR